MSTLGSDGYSAEPTSSGDASAGQAAGRWLGDAVGIAALMLFVFVLLGQQTFYGVDAQNIVRQLARPEESGEHYVHFLFIPCLRALTWPLRAFGLGAYDAALGASMLGAALGVFFVHRCLLALGFGRGECALGSVLVATTPALLFFATVVEFHGLFFGFAGFAWWMCGRAIERPSSGRLLFLGVSIAIAGFVHATGQLLSPLLVGWFLASLPRRSVHAFLLASTAVLTHAALWFAVPRLLGIQAESQAKYWQEYFEMLRPWSEAFDVLFHEWLWPFAPLSLLWLAAAWQRGWRLHVAVLALALVLYLSTCFVLIPRGHERGAYELPLTVSAAILALRSLRLRYLAMTAVLGLGLGIQAVVAHDRSPPPASWLLALRSQPSPGDSLLLLGPLEDQNAVMRDAPDVESQLVYSWLDRLAALPEAQREQGHQAIAMLLDDWISKKTVWFTEGAEKQLAAHPIGRRLRRFLGLRYRFVESKTPGLSAWKLERR